jgi:hypothetical protein
MAVGAQESKHLVSQCSVFINCGFLTLQRAMSALPSVQFTDGRFFLDLDSNNRARLA